ncbi:MAG: hypothetical protein P8Z37_06670 [Acidobacteriota bacterium]
MCANHCKKALQAMITIGFIFFSLIQVAVSAELKQETILAWNDYVQKTEKRIAQEVESDNHFLIMDYQDKDKIKHELNSLLSGNVVVHEMESQNNGLSLRIPGGKIHHWRGAVFIPGIDLDFALARIKNPKPIDFKQEDVLESRILERSPEEMKLFLKLQRSKIVTVVYNTEHSIYYTRYSDKRASSKSIATKIAEVEQFEDNKEREKPQGKDHGFLWRLNSYWRYRQFGDGVIIECESLTLSRSIPRLLDFVISPLINRVARESMERTLTSLRARMLRDTENPLQIEHLSEADISTQNQKDPSL